MTPKDQAYTFIKRTLIREREMRKRVLHGETKEAKIREIDDALKHLDVLHTPTAEPEQQASLF